ncbi:MAG: hypothetical protein JO107_08460 [Hyphomicrobiales bacterium]|nr:hypothetical protein [Hyphomicrobiales bacterium]MBV8663122.1 hypothetical protein [Hyphomicrobiales bacterium]
MMLRSALLAALAIALGASAASAGTFPVPDENPIATVSIPDAWEPKAYDGGVEATSNDGAIYIAVEQVKAEDIKSAIEEGIKFFLKSGVDIDAASQKQTETKINGLDAFDLSFAGKDKNGPTNVSLTLVKTNAPGKILMLYYWGSPDGEKANATELQKVSDSIQATK